MSTEIVRKRSRLRPLTSGRTRVLRGLWLAVGSTIAVAFAQDTPPPTAPPAQSASTVVYVYPAKGQTEAQADRDRYECHLWAVKQTGFDPSEPQLAPHQRVAVVEGPPPGQDAVAGAATGAILGAAVARPGNAGQGAAIGAVLGGVIGGASGAARNQREREEVQQHMDAREAERAARLEEQSRNYRRAISACLEGRGYKVSE
jgi:Glycine zipper